MSGLKPIEMTLLHRSLAARGTSLGKMAGKIFTARSHLSEVVSGNRTGIPTWRRIIKARLFTAKELALLGRDKAGHKLPEASPVPRGSNSHVEHQAEAIA